MGEWALGGSCVSSRLHATWNPQCRKNFSADHNTNASSTVEYFALHPCPTDLPGISPRWLPETRIDRLLSASTIMDGIAMLLTRHGATSSFEANPTNAIAVLDY